MDWTSCSVIFCFHVNKYWTWKIDGITSDIITMFNDYGKKKKIKGKKEGGKKLSTLGGQGRTLGVFALTARLP